MTTKNDWDSALDTWIEEERERLGGPPSPEDVAAYLSGELPPEEAARVRALLVYYPELTPLLTRRIDKPRAVRRPVALQVYALAATVLVAILGANGIIERRRSAEPAVVSAHYELNANLTRSGAGSRTIIAGQQRYLVTLVPPAPPTAPEYTLEIARESKVVWRADRVRPVDGAFVLDVPGRFLQPGTYALTIRAGDQLIERYPLRVVPVERRALSPPSS